LTFYNKVILIGNLAENPDIRFTPSGSQVTKLSLQINPNRGAKGVFNPETIDVIAFERHGHQQGQSLSKGCWVFVEGKIQTRSWETSEGLKRKKIEIIAERVCPLKNEGPLRS
jgi:single-strand DNA-binding protein